ncbi:toll/interleukin-1 receptor domain-containing protein [Flavobacterium sp. 3HN19-14]|uniref:toll/interleukin-1 receptor domain-containing protein n=1 Tax=Flavobacterium sp. 3HN19-14 TaxID=3448133 RepID=UPI003EE2FA9E
MNSVFFVKFVCYKARKLKIIDIKIKSLLFNMASIFMSHRIKDNDEAENLANHLRNEGHNVWLDIWEINIGDSILKKMNEGLQSANYLILCYSDEGVESEYISREWYAALHMQLQGKSIKILPVRLTGGTAPAILQDIKYADLAKDYDIGLSQLLKAIK